MPEETLQFFEAIFAHKPEASKIVIWTLPDRASRFLDSPADAAHAAHQVADGRDVYFGAGLMREALGATRRGTKRDVAAITSLWIDIDIAGAGHKDSRKTLPPTAGAAEELLAKILIEPSAVINSGGGLQAYWFLKEPLVFAGDDDAWKSGELLCLNWTRTIQAQAKAAGFDVDSTFDLTRVMRVPGTFNRKTDTPRPVKLLRINDLRYDPSDFESLFISPLIPAEQKKTQDEPIETIKAHGLTLDPKASPPLDKFEALAEIEPRFRLSWDRKRPELKDQSASSYDLSLATFACSAEWTDQEIADLMIASRRKHKDNLKLRIDYYARTIARARQTTRRDQAVDNLQASIDTRAHSADAPADSNGDHLKMPELPDAQRRAETLIAISDALGAKIVRIVKYLQDPPRYRIQTEKSGIEIGTVEHLISQSSLRSALAASDGHYIPKFRSDDWDALAQSLLDACDIVETGDESTDLGAIQSWLERYIDENPPSEANAASIANNVPIYNSGDQREPFIYFFLSHFREWLYRREQEKLSGKMAGILLRRFNAKPEILSHIDETSGKQTTRSVWKLPFNHKTKTIGRKQRKPQIEIKTKPTPKPTKSATLIDADPPAPF